MLVMKRLECKMAILERRDKNAVAYLTLNLPKRLNALSDEMLDALQTTFDSFHTDKSVRAIVLAGAGKAFCAGHDLKQMTEARKQPDGGAALFKNLFDRCADFMQTVQAVPQPVIAQVHGIATAAGCQLVATCDLAVASHETKFGVNGVNIGLFCSTPMVALSRNIQRKRAFEMLVTGEFMGAEEAKVAGLINRVVPESELLSSTISLAEVITSKLGSAVTTGKKAFYKQIQLPTSDAYTYTGNVMVDNMLNKDTEEGIAAFINKRDPNWSQDL
jgi:enoyl-CoA hydratase/carnithine racemase